MILSFQVKVPTVCLPTDSDMAFTVSVDLPPKNSSVSQQSTMVSASSLYLLFSCARDCR